MKSRKGSALVLVICVMVVVATFMGIINMYFMTNAAQATKQRERIQAYYLVAAGLEIGISALMEPAINASGEQYYPLLDYYAANPAPGREYISLGEDKEVEISISAVDSEGETWKNGKSSGDVWILISALGTYTNSLGSTVQAGSLRINSENPAKIIRELEVP